MNHRKNPKPWQSIKRLVHYVAHEKDPNDLIARIASDADMLEAARRVHVEWQRSGGCTQEQMIMLCRAYGISQEYLGTRIRTIVYCLNLAKRPEDFYEILELSPDATPDEIKHSYRRLSLAWHPDKNPANARASEHFRLIHEAYRTLRDERLRRLYDRSILAPYWCEAKEECAAQHPCPKAWYRRASPLLLCLVSTLIILAGYDGCFLYHCLRSGHRSTCKKDLQAVESEKGSGPCAQDIEDSLVFSPPEREQQPTSARIQAPLEPTLGSTPSLLTQNADSSDNSAGLKSQVHKRTKKPPPWPHSTRHEKTGTKLSKKILRQGKPSCAKTRRR